MVWPCTELAWRAGHKCNEGPRLSLTGLRLCSTAAGTWGCAASVSAGWGPVCRWHVSQALGQGWGLSCARICAGSDAGSLPACSQHHGPEPAQPHVFEALLVVLEWAPPQVSPLNPSTRQGTLGDSWEGDGCWGTTGHEQWPGLARVTGAPTAHTHPAPSSFSLLHSFAHCQHPAPHTMCLRLKCRRKGTKGRGNQEDHHGEHWHCHLQRLPGPPKGDLPIP